MRLVLRWLKVVAINLLITFGLLIFIELVFGTWFDGQGAIVRFDARPDTVEHIVSPVYPPGVTITNRRNHFGFRGGADRASDIDILAIGGSTTAERLLDDNDMWTAVLQRLLREENCAVTIANAGIDGYATAGNIASFGGWFDNIPDLKPRFVLAYLGINDSVANPSKVNVLDSERYPTRWRQIQHFVAAHSAVRWLFTQLRGWLRARNAKLLYNQGTAPRNVVWQEATLRRDLPAIVAAKVAAYRQRLATLNQIIHKFGATPVYITQARADGRVVDGQWEEAKGTTGAEFTATLWAINDATMAFCRDTGESCIDLAHQINFTVDDFADNIHTTVAGSARVARYLAGLLPPIICGKAR